MAVAADVLSALLTFVFGSAAIAKLLRQKQHVQTAAKLQIAWERYRWIGVPEAAAAAGLVLGYARAPFGAAAGMGLVVLMAGALFFRLRVHDSAGYLLGDAALLGAAAATAALRIGIG
jgi:hypothetical protein